MSEKIAVIGLGYVGLPVAVALAERFPGVVGFDISRRRVDALREGIDWTGEIENERLSTADLIITHDASALAGASFVIVTVPTPIDDERRPDLEPIRSSCRVLAPHMSEGVVVVFESTVYPGVTEEVCGPLLEELSGLKRGRDFFLGYSPERINPGDKLHRLESITKVIAADNESTLARLRTVYGAIIEAGLHEAPSIRVAEAAKVIENTQRDLNIALMNEIALIFDRMGIRTTEVLAAAGTKWNFLPFTPGLVGGHCIGVDPYYLTAAAERYGYLPEVILAGRRINDGMGAYIANKMVKLLASAGRPVTGSRVAILGLTFKENVPDLRNSKVPDIVHELREFGIEILIHDPVASRAEALTEFGLELTDLEQCHALDGVILAVGHKEYLNGKVDFGSMLGASTVLIDVKSVLDPRSLNPEIVYWSL